MSRTKKNQSINILAQASAAGFSLRKYGFLNQHWSLTVPAIAQLNDAAEIAPENWIKLIELG